MCSRPTERKKFATTSGPSSAAGTDGPPLALDTVWSPLHWNLLRMAYQPCHIVELAVLPTLTARAGEEPPAFAERTATDLANELGIAATPHTTEEKRAAMKKLKKAGQAKVLREGPEAVLRAD